MKKLIKVTKNFFKKTHTFTFPGKGNVMICSNQVFTRSEEVKIFNFFSKILISKK